MATDDPRSYNGKGFTVEVEPHIYGKCALPGALNGFAKVATDRQEQGEHMFSNRDLGIIRHIANRNPVSRAVCEVNVVNTGGSLGDELQIFKFFQDAGSL